MILKVLDLLIRLGAFSIIGYISMENFSNTRMQNIIIMFSIFLVIIVPYTVKFRSLDYLSKIYKEMKYIWPMLNIILAIFVVIYIHNTPSPEDYFLSGGIACLLIAIIQTLDLLFIKRTALKIIEKQRLAS
ncbi:hypothetical protein IR145_09605 [Streptococcus danieliae]|nr:hypothetical protein [Gemella sp. 19428wG2_WT2a]MBF0847705.1 hypothetical protein [Streptococcus danieliae]TFU57538.1 hypothetical protein E4T67_06695 [Gemella sp. WT2a]